MNAEDRVPPPPPRPWFDELAEWLQNGPRPHEPPGGARSVYGWLKRRGPEILRWQRNRRQAK